MCKPRVHIPNIQWNTPAIIELKVKEPNGTCCHVLNNISPNGYLSTECLGYGPLVYTSHKAEPGAKYNFIIKWAVGNNAAHHDCAIAVRVTVWINFARQNEQEFFRTIILRKETEEFEVGQVVFA